MYFIWLSQNTESKMTSVHVADVVLHAFGIEPVSRDFIPSFVGGNMFEVSWETTLRISVIIK